MIFPSVYTGVEQQHGGFRAWIDAGQIGALVCIAPIASKREDRNVVGASVLFCHDMIQVECYEGHSGLSNPAILTCVAGPVANQIASSLIQFKRPAVKESVEPLPA